MRSEKLSLPGEEYPNATWVHRTRVVCSDPIDKSSLPRRRMPFFALGKRHIRHRQFHVLKARIEECQKKIPVYAISSARRHTLHAMTEVNQG